jgi:hypothetical protein
VHLVDVAKKRVTPVVQLTLPTQLVRAVDGWARREGRRRMGARVTRSQAVRELLTAALRAAEPVSLYRLGKEPPIDEATARLTPTQRVELISELTREAYALKGEDVVPGIRRDVVRLGRRTS